MASISTQKITVAKWRVYEKNTLKGFVSLTTPSGMTLHDCTFHRKGESAWVNIPAKQYQKDGVTTWESLITFESKEARERFQSEALIAIDNYLASNGGANADPF